MLCLAGGRPKGRNLFGRTAAAAGAGHHRRGKKAALARRCLGRGDAISPQLFTPVLGDPVRGPGGFESTRSTRASNPGLTQRRFDRKLDRQHRRATGISRRYSSDRPRRPPSSTLIQRRIPRSSTVTQGTSGIRNVSGLPRRGPAPTSRCQPVHLHHCSSRIAPAAPYCSLREQVWPKFLAMPTFSDPPTAGKLHGQEPPTQPPKTPRRVDHVASQRSPHTRPTGRQRQVNSCLRSQPDLQTLTKSSSV